MNKPTAYVEVYYNSKGKIQSIEWGYLFVSLILFPILYLLIFFELINYLIVDKHKITEEDYYKRKIWELKNK